MAKDTVAYTLLLKRRKCSLTKDQNMYYHALCFAVYAHYCCANSSQEDFDFISRCCKLKLIVAVKS